MKSTQLLFLLFISVAAWAGGPAKSNFTAMEVNHIRVKTPGLFNGRKSFSIHLDSMTGGRARALRAELRRFNTDFSISFSVIFL